jgi:predicted dehydrogenase
MRRNATLAKHYANRHDVRKYYQDCLELIHNQDVDAEQCQAVIAACEDARGLPLFVAYFQRALPVS